MTLRIIGALAAFFIGGVLMLVLLRPPPPPPVQHQAENSTPVDAPASVPPPAPAAPTVPVKTQWVLWLNGTCFSDEVLTPAEEVTNAPLVGRTARIVDKGGDEVMVIEQDQYGRTLNARFFRGMDACHLAVERAATDLDKYR
jgi:hypothetical protein